MLSYILGTFRFIVNLYVSTVWARAVVVDRAAAISIVTAFFMVAPRCVVYVCVLPLRATIFTRF